MKLGLVPYLNALPLHAYLTHPFVLLPPSTLEKKIFAGEIDLALLPTLSYLKRKDLIPLFEAGLIQSMGAVESVMVSYPQKLGHPSQIRSIKFTSESVTSIALFKVIYRFYWNGSLDQLQLDHSPQAAYLEIGDKAFNLPSKGRVLIDLGQVWSEWTGLPFIYALWVARTPPSKEIIQKIIEARKKGMQNLDFLCSKQKILPADQALHYLTKCMRYEMDEKSLEAITLFQQYCFELGLIPCLKNLKAA